MEQRKQFVEKLKVSDNICDYIVRSGDDRFEWFKAYAEVYQLIYHTEATIRKLIPESFMVFLKEHMDKQWHGDLDFSKSMDEMNLLKNARIILSLVYSDFICSEDERKHLIEKDKAEMKKKRMLYKDVSLREYFKF